MAIVRRMQLQGFSCEAFLLEHLSALLGGDAPIPPLLSLPSPLHYRIDATSAALIVKLAPTLTSLDGRFEDLPGVEASLTQLTKITTLRMKVAHCCMALAVYSLLAGLRSMPQLTDLCLQHPDLASAHLAAILSKLQLLQRLSLDSRTSAVDSLAFLAHAPSTLRELRIEGGSLMPVGEACHLEKLLKMESVCLTHVFRAWGFWIPRMEPKSSEFDRATWPTLKSFRCTQ
jgi:hypothetical protein